MIVELNGFQLINIIAQSQKSNASTMPAIPTAAIKQIKRKKVYVDLNLVSSYSEFFLHNVSTQGVSLRNALTQVWLGSQEEFVLIDLTPADFGALLPIGPGTDPSKVKVSSADTTADFLENKLVAGTNIIVTKNNVGLDEELEVSTNAEENVNADWNAISGDAEILNKPTSWGNYAQTIQSAVIATAPEQSIIGTGVGSLSIPANAFAVGDSFHGKMGGVINATGGGGRSEIIVRIKTGTTVLASTGIFDLDTASSQGWEIELDFTIATIGDRGTICTNGNFAYTKDASRQVFGYIFQDVQPIDTTISNTLDITVEWNVLNSGDDIYSANFVLYKVF